MNQQLFFYFIHFSEFHGNADVIWLSTNGLASIQRAQKDQSRGYSIKVPNQEFAQISDFIEEAGSTSLKVNERIAIPDEVIIKFGFRDKNRNWISIRVIENDWHRQPSAIQKFNTIAQRLIDMTNVLEPVHVEQFAPGKLVIQYPGEFLSNDIREALK